MLRGLVLLVLLANALLYAWGVGALSPPLAAPEPQREPERLNNQVNPEKFRLVGAAPNAPSSAATSPVPLAEASASADATVCLVSSGNAAAPTLAQALKESLAGAGYTAEIRTAESRDGVQFMVYMGKLADKAAVRTKLAELRGFGVKDFAAINDEPAWAPGISLGVYSSRESADVRLKSVSDDGVRTEKIVERSAGTAVLTFTLPVVAEADRSKLGAAVLAAGAKPLQVCTP